MEVIERKFYRKAMDDLDAASAAIAIKANERRVTLSGTNKVQAHVVPLEREMSTEQTRQARDRLRFVSPKQRELADRAKYGDGPPLNEAEKAELEALCKEFNYADALLSIRRGPWRWTTLLGRPRPKVAQRIMRRRPRDLHSVLTFLGGPRSDFRSMDFLKLVPNPAGHQDSGLV
jgi:hypothetical protein